MRSFKLEREIDEIFQSVRDSGHAPQVDTRAILMNMAIATQMTVEEYLRTSFDPDCEYVDGEVLERNVGETDHGLDTAAPYWSIWRFARKEPSAFDHAGTACCN